MRTTRTLVTIFGLLWIGLQSASAQLLDLTLTPAVQAGGISSQLTFSGTLQNLTASELFLNGSSLIANGTGLFGDDTLFIMNAPLSLMPQGTAGDNFSGDLFVVTIDPAAQGGNFSGSFSVIGGFTDQDNINLATQNFAVQVVPEPGVSAFLVGMLLPVVGFHYRRKFPRS